MTNSLTTNGLILDSNFPAQLYEEVQSKVRNSFSDHSLYDHYAGAWNALACRFQGAVNSGAAFSNSIAVFGTSPNPSVRFRQEHELFCFFSAGLSAFESAFYAAFTRGAFLSPSDFPIARPEDQKKVTPSLTIGNFGRGFAIDPILAVFNTLVSDARYLQWREVRNVLTHRTAPGRIFNVSNVDVQVPADEWKLNNILLDGNLVSSRLAELGRLVGNLV